MNGLDRPAKPRWGDDPTPSCINSLASPASDLPHAGMFAKGKPSKKWRPKVHAVKTGNRYILRWIDRDGVARQKNSLLSAHANEVEIKAACLSLQAALTARVNATQADDYEKRVYKAELGRRQTRED